MLHCPSVEGLTIWKNSRRRTAALQRVHMAVRGPLAALNLGAFFRYLAVISASTFPNAHNSTFGKMKTEGPDDAPGACEPRMETSEQS